MNNKLFILIHNLPQNYILYTNWKQKQIKHKKWFRKWILRQRFKENELYYYEKRMIYPPIYWQISIGFYPTVPYNAYQGQFWWIKRKFINFKYHIYIKFIKKKNVKIRSRKKLFFFKYIRRRYRKIHNFLYLYNFFFFSISTDLYYLVKFSKARRQRVFHFLIFSFTKSRLYINLQNFLKKNYLFLSTGLFIRFFERKKSLKKSKTIKLLMAKFLRKLFLISCIRNTIVIVKKNPLFFLEMMNLFNTAVPYKFVNPINEEIIEEKPTDFLWIKFLYFVFLNNNNYSINRTKKRGRIKRKIFRKLVFTNKIID